MIKNQLEEYFHELRQNVQEQVIVVNHDGLTHVYDTSAFQQVIVSEFPDFLQTEIYDFLRLIDYDEDLILFFFEQTAEFYVNFMLESKVGA